MCRESMQPVVSDFYPPAPLDTGTVDGNGWRKLLCPKRFRQPDPLSKAAGQWMPVGQWSSPTVGRPSPQLCAGPPDPVPCLTERFPPFRRVHFREGGSLANSPTPRAIPFSSIAFGSPLTFPTAVPTCP